MMKTWEVRVMKAGWVSPTADWWRVERHRLMRLIVATGVDYHAGAHTHLISPWTQKYTEVETLLPGRKYWWDPTIFIHESLMNIWSTWTILQSYVKHSFSTLQEVRDSLHHIKLRMHFIGVHTGEAFPSDTLQTNESHLNQIRNSSVQVLLWADKC